MQFIYLILIIILITCCSKDNPEIIGITTEFTITSSIINDETVGFEQDYSNTEVFLNYGVLFAPKFRLNQNNQMGVSAFVPLVKDKAQSGYQFGLGWTRNFVNK